MKILMVALGDVCRGPMAWGIMKRKISEHKLHDWTVDTAAVRDWHIKQFPYFKTIEEAKRNFIDVSKHLARKFSVSDFDDFDHIFVMDTPIYERVAEVARDEKDMDKVDYLMNIAHPNENKELEDPYWNDFIYQDVFDMIDEACEAFIAKMVKKKPQPVKLK